MSKKTIYLSIVIPAYNEESNFKKGSLIEVSDFLKVQNFSWEVIVVNDGSTDNTFKLLKNFSINNPGFKVLDIVHGGKVTAVTSGIRQAKGELVIFTDFDQSTPISETVNILKKFKKGADVVIAQRKEISGWSFIKKLRSRFFNLLVQLILLPGIKDTQCGFKAFKTPLAKKLFNSLLVTQKTQKGGYMGAFDVELLYLAQKQGYKIMTIDVEWHFVESKRLSWSEPFKMLRDIILVRIYSIINYYKLD